jgi:hypothetical protein
MKSRKKSKSKAKSRSSKCSVCRKGGHNARTHVFEGVT